MIYITPQYYVFVAVILAVYYLLPVGHRYLALLSGSLLFYWYLSEGSIIRFSGLLIIAFFCWFLSRHMHRESQHGKKVLVVSVSVLSILLLAVKEIQYVSDIIIRKPVPDWWLVPVGFSFFSIQLIAYCADVYMQKIEAEPHFLKFLLFVSFFPQIVQGPIPRYQQLSGQLTEGHLFREKQFVKGFHLILWGFFLKLCIADKAGIVVDTIFDHYPTYQGAYVLVGGILYSFQLYADFYACTALAQGVSGLFGIDLVNNFERPYFATSVKDFWRRWHISFSSWLRDYVYIPLGGNRRGKNWKHVNILLTFAISGIWHGGGLKFLFWGLLHGFYQIAGDRIRPFKERIGFRSGRILQGVCTFILVMFAWIIFRADRLTTAFFMIRSVFTIRNPWILTDDSLFSLGLGIKEFYLLLFCLGILLVVSLLKERGVEIRETVLSYNLSARWFIYICTILFIVVFGTYGWGFDAKDFIYGGF